MVNAQLSTNSSTASRIPGIPGIPGNTVYTVYTHYTGIYTGITPKMTGTIQKQL
jgi:hypothetical protein